jgi:N-acetylneuraminic acid mutarotase
MRPGRLAKQVGSAVLLVFVLVLAVFAFAQSNSASEPGKDVPANSLGSIGTVTWTNMTPSNAPAPRGMSAFAYDPPSGSFVLFGGFDADSNFFNDTWSYNLGLNSWQNLSPVQHPDMTDASAYAYDSAQQEMILFPVFNLSNIASPVFNETWSYDSSANNWSNLEASNAPEIGIGGSAAYDSQSDKLVLFGGVNFASGANSNETWSYDFTTNNWTNLTTVQSPPALLYTTMAYDSESDRVIMFGGIYQDSMGNNIPLNDTWSYDFDSNTWTNMSPASSPHERLGAASVYDPVSDQVIIFGGANETGAYDDLWAYDYNSNSWSEVTQISKPTARAFGMMSIDPSTRTIVLFGGWADVSGNALPLNDTWAAQLGVPIPEFSTVLLPVLGVVVAITALAASTRRTQGKKKD